MLSIRKEHSYLLFSRLIINDIEIIQQKKKNNKRITGDDDI